MKKEAAYLISNNYELDADVKALRQEQIELLEMMNRLMIAKLGA